MGKLIILLFLIALLCFAGYVFFQILKAAFGGSEPGQLYWCACGCGRKFHSGAGWDGYHGPNFDEPVQWDAQMLEEKKPQQKALDYNPDNVLSWEDIQWNVEKKLKDER